MHDVHSNVQLVASKGPLATYIQGDRLLSGFSAAAGRLDVALGLVARAAEPYKMFPVETKVCGGRGRVAHAQACLHACVCLCMLVSDTRHVACAAVQWAACDAWPYMHHTFATTSE